MNIGKEAKAELKGEATADSKEKSKTADTSKTAQGTQETPPPKPKPQPRGRAKENELLRYFSIKKPQGLQVSDEGSLSEERDSKMILPSIVKPKGSISKASNRNTSKEVRFRNFDMKDKVQESFALDNRDSQNIQKIFKKDEKEKTEREETSWQREKRLKQEEEAKKRKKREYVYYDEKKAEDVKGQLKKDLVKRLEERSKRNVVTNRNFDEFFKKRKDKEVQDDIKSKVANKLVKSLTASRL